MSVFSASLSLILSVLLFLCLCVCLPGLQRLVTQWGNLSFCTSSGRLCCSIMSSPNGVACKTQKIPVKARAHPCHVEFRSQML